MGLSGGIILILLGGLCLPSLVAEKSPMAKDVLDQIAPYQDWVGLVLFIRGVYGIISVLISLEWLLNWPLLWTTQLAGNLMTCAGGAVLGFGIIKKYILPKASVTAREKAEALYEELAERQNRIGIACIVTGLWVLLYELVLRSNLNM